MNLIIVESPTKARTLGRFLGKDYQIMASMGHLRDLPRKTLAVDVEHGFKPEYALVEGKGKIVSELKSAAKKAKKIILATDPDREGEAIAYHVAVILNGRLDQSAAILMSPSESNSRKTLSASEKDSGARIAKSHKIGQTSLAESSKFERITFHEITKSAVEEALKKPGKINVKLFDAQQARRILDRLVGYKLSPLLWRKVRRGLSAGRVQTVALRLIVEREKEIEKFGKKEYWSIDARLSAVFEKNSGAHDHLSESSLRGSVGSGVHKVTGPRMNISSRDHFAPSSEDNKNKIGQTSQKLFSSFLASLYSKNSEKYEKTTTLELFAGKYTYKESRIKNKESSVKIEKDLKKQTFVVEKINEREVKRQPPPPFTTSTLQQAAHNVFGYSGKKTMALAQRLYEKGLITYHRTDSFYLSQQAIKGMREFIKNEFDDRYLSENVRVYKTKSKNAQEAHEAIRPTDIKVKAETAEKKLYDLIWKRALATQMSAASLAQTSVDVKAGPYLLRSTGARTLFDGWQKLYPKRLSEKLLPKLEEGQKLKLMDVIADQNFTSPPPRYNEASLVKTLESKEIGRPSTYAAIISVLQTRAYVEKKEGAFWPTAVGEAVILFLAPNFPDVVDIPFTAEMEEDLDAIARGEKKWRVVLERFYIPFEKKLGEVLKNSERVKIEVEKTGKKCPECKKGDIVIRTGKFGKFLSCSRFPDCKWKGNYEEKVGKCPECGKAIVVRRTRKGKTFYGCAGWPKCKWASWRKPVLDKKIKSAS